MLKCVRLKLEILFFGEILTQVIEQPRVHFFIEISFVITHGDFDRGQLNFALQRFNIKSIFEAVEQPARDDSH
jgi:hypothetical protein